MNSTKKNILIGVIVVVVLVLGYVMLFRGKAMPSTSNGATTTVQSVFDPNATTSQTIVTSSGTYTITPVGETPVPMAPDYKAPVLFAANIEPNVRAAINAQLAQTQDVIAKDPLSFEAWVNLGTLHKIGGDYQGAADMWRYVASIYSKSTVPLDNLAGLYMDFIKNYPKAETNLKASIALDSHDIHAYEALAELYSTYGYKTKADAVAIVNQGLAANPSDATLMQLKAQLSQ